MKISLFAGDIIVVKNTINAFIKLLELTNIINNVEGTKFSYFLMSQ